YYLVQCFSEFEQVITVIDSRPLELNGFYKFHSCKFSRFCYIKSLSLMKQVPAFILLTQIYRLFKNITFKYKIIICSYSHVSRFGSSCINIDTGSSSAVET